MSAGRSGKVTRIRARVVASLTVLSFGGRHTRCSWPPNAARKPPPARGVHPTMRGHQCRSFDPVRRSETTFDAVTSSRPRLWRRSSRRSLVRAPLEVRRLRPVRPRESGPGSRVATSDEHAARSDEALAARRRPRGRPAFARVAQLPSPNGRVRSPLLPGTTTEGFQAISTEAVVPAENATSSTRRRRSPSGESL